MPRQRHVNNEPLVITVPKDHAVARMIRDGREALPLKLAVRATRSFSGEDFATLSHADLRLSLLGSLNSVMERNGRPLLRTESVRLKVRPCGRDASGAPTAMYYALGVACSKEDAGLLRTHVEAACGGALPLDLGRSGPAHAMLYDGDDPTQSSFHLDLSTDPFGNVGPEVALSLLQLQGLDVASVTELTAMDVPAESNMASRQYRVTTSVGRCPVEGDPDAHVARNWPRPAAVAGDRQLVALVSGGPGGQKFLSNTMQAGGWVRLQVEGDDERPHRERFRIWRMNATVPPRARPTRVVAEQQAGAADPPAEKETPSQQPAAASQELSAPAAASGPEQEPSSPEAVASPEQQPPLEALAVASPAFPADQPASSGTPIASAPADALPQQPETMASSGTTASRSRDSSPSRTFAQVVSAHAAASAST